MVEAKSILEEIERWQSIYDWFAGRDKLRAAVEGQTQIDSFDAEAKHVKDLLSKITLGIKLNPQEPSK